MDRILRICAPLCAAALLVPAVASADRQQPRRAAGPDCPDRALALPRDPLGPATRVALARERRADDPQATEAAIATQAGARGREVRRACGRRAWRRTVVVQLDLRALHPSASLSERVDFVSRFRGGWRVWEVAH